MQHAMKTYGGVWLDFRPGSFKPQENSLPLLIW
jgi:hypothetical protein